MTIRLAIRKGKVIKGRRLCVLAGLAALALTVSLATLAARSEAAFPGTPGKIGFDSTRDGNTEIYVMDADGSDPTRLTDNPAIDRDAAFSADGKRIAFVNQRNIDDPATSEVYVMDFDGLNSSNLTQLTHNTAGDFQPVFSPDGHRIAFASDRDGDMEIFVMQADGTKERRLTNNATFDAQPTFSPNGQRIAFVSARDGNDEIYTMNANGTKVRRLTNTPTSESRPNYSPGGSRIAFRTNRTGNGDIYVMNADGTGETPLTSDPGLDVDPAFSPDGQQIVFRSNRVDVDGMTDADIYVMSADGSGQTNLTTGPTGQYADRRPDWQPIPAIP